MVHNWMAMVCVQVRFGHPEASLFMSIVIRYWLGNARQPDSSNLNWFPLFILGENDINSKGDTLVMASVYHALYVAARNIDNGDLT